MPKGFIGQRIAPASGIQKSTGTATFASDVYLDGMLHAKVLRSPVPFAKLLRVDTSRARALSGVESVLTFEDVPKVRFGNYAFAKRKGVADVETKRIQDIFVLDDMVKYAGDEIAAVAAEDEDTALAALDLIEVEYERLPEAVTPEEVLRPDAIPLHPEGNLIHPPEGVSPTYRPGKGSEPTFLFERGDVEAGFREADRVFERTYTVPFVNAASMEPRSCVAWWEGEKLTLWDSTQAPFKVRGEIARVLNIPKEQVRVITSFVGGGFGNKGVVHRYQLIAAILSMKTGKPVRLAYSRRDEFLGGLQRYSARYTVKMGVKNDGTLAAIDIKNFANWGNNARGTVRPLFYGMSSPMLLYRKCKNAKYEAYATYTNLPSAGAYRGFGDPEIQFGIESLLDEIADSLGIDPIQLRLRNRVEMGDDLLPLFPGEFMSSVGLDECIAKGAERIGWHRREKSRDSAATGARKRRGIGFAASIHTGGHLVPANSIMEVAPDGLVELKIPLPDIGTEQQLTQRQIAADSLGIDLARIRVGWGDTQGTDEDFGIHGSRGTYMIGRCTAEAAEALKKRCIEYASQRLEIDSAVLEFRDGAVWGGEQPVMALAECSREAASRGERLLARGTVEETNAVWSFSAHFAEVEVDTWTGEVKPLRIVAALDVGRAVNPLVLEGQIEGAALQGLGYALSEELVRDPVVRGTTLNCSLLTYEVPSILDVPLVEPVIVESWETSHPFGAKGGGEAGIIGVAPAIANAIYNATGLRFWEIPITPDRVLRALQATREAQP